MTDGSPALDPRRLLAQSRWLHALARNLARGDDAEDLVQETWRIALERPPRVESDSSLRAWLGTVARNLASHRKRSAAMRRGVEERLHRERGDGRAEGAHELALLHKRLADAVLELDDPYKTAIVMRYFEGRELREIAELQGISYDTLRQRVSRALSTLRARLDRDYGGNRSAWSVLCFGLARSAGISASSVTIAGGAALSAKAIASVGLLATAAVLGILWWRGTTTGSPGETAVAVPTPTRPAPVTSSNEPAGSSAERRALISAPAPATRAVDRDHDLHGIVLDPNEQPVGGARVVVLHNELSEIHSLDANHRFESTVIATTATDASGAFAIEVPQGRAVDLGVDAEGFAHASLEHCHAGERLVVRLERGAGLTGRVMRRADSLLLARALVQLGRSNTNSLPESTPRLETRSDERGVYHFRSLASGSYYAWVFAAEGALLLERIEIAPGAEIVHDFLLEGGRAVSGRVVDATNGTPIADAEIADGSRFERTTRTDAKGEFTFYGLSFDRDAQLVARAPGYGRGELSLRKSGDESRITGVEIRLQHGRVARGRVIDSAGAPITAAYVAATAYRGGPMRMNSDWESTRSDAEGRFEIGDLRADLQHVLWVQREGLASAAIAFPKEESQLSTIDFGDIRLQPPASLRGTLVDESGHPFPRHDLRLTGWNDDVGAFGNAPASKLERPRYERIALQDAQASVLENFLGERKTRTDDLGRFSFGDLAAGSYMLGARLDGAREEATLSVPISEAERVEGVELVLPRGLAIEGRVAGPNGEPLFAFVDVQIELGFSGVATGGMTHTDASGHFRIEGLSPAEYMVTAVPQPRADDRGVRWLQVQQRRVAAGTRALDLVAPRAGKLGGDVTTSAGGIATAVDVEAIGSADGASVHAEVDDRGHFELWLPDDQTYNLCARPLVPDSSRPGQTRFDLDDAKAARIPGVATGGPPVKIRMP